MSFVAVATERMVLYSQIAVRLIDEFTGDLAQHPVTPLLSYRDSAGEWQPTSLSPVPTPSGNLLFPGLGRSANVAAAPIVRHRLQLTSTFYRPDYLSNADGLEFDVHPYDDLQAPAVLPTLPFTVLLLPSPMYPYPAFMRSVRGQTLDAMGAPIANAEVAAGLAERVLSDDRGVFALPLRWTPFSGNVLLDAVDHRTGRTGQLTLALPQDLQQGQIFTLT
ncbi:hypothetical protein H4CHR_00517 [Variovorax sp. PBS-H4]|uniref:carboxypeptidase-like regulatory domain-containing protein n=1 Tax=Variovorax sp. PBS-H4 TaxID=434008 RepID=UPI0013164D32|nr:carboxypeptidase-like regulatory domain-containing protein [Variovorax sp. PBS-H4]VTU20098.1 hypothetical protein H4CHR_00517 [Variovorax sp. PBS-H4]